MSADHVAEHVVAKDCLEAHQCRRSCKVDEWSFCCLESVFFVKQHMQTRIAIGMQGFRAINFTAKNFGSIGIVVDCNWNLQMIAGRVAGPFSLAVFL